VDDLAGDERLAAALTLLAYQLAEIAPRVLVRRVDQAERRQLAARLAEIAADLRAP
jgi:hypothetical protein